ncbi:phosphotransferase family protein [Paenibacillus guangzhouensis]|uniref:phosphotransferase family protein n=1 Tax=Paenibacillus guangzhouensis TaxID=1473112 RepID=UPI00187BA875|nr:aminoglycoside phosphotransferase family protein [Paenibacillus guangzhouensis]
MIELQEAIASGRTAEIFEYEDGYVLKLFKSSIPEGIIDQEFRISQSVHHAGVPVPKAIKMVHIQDRKGIVYERIAGETMLNRIKKRPWSMIRESKRMAKLHTAIHRMNMIDLPSQYDILMAQIAQAPLLTEHEKVDVTHRMSELERDTKLCHGDFHPDNIVLSEREWIIDWMTGTMGQPAADIARTVILLKIGTMPDDTPRWVVYVFSRWRRLILSVYLRQYLANSNVTEQSIDDWMIPVAAARLAEGVPDQEKHTIVKFIRQNLNKAQIGSK